LLTVSIHFSEAIPIAVLRLIINVASVLLLSGGHHHHHHGHAHDDEEDHGHDDHATDRDNNMRAAIIHVMADAAVSVLVIVGLVLARLFGWMWLRPLAGIMGAIVIAIWSYALVRDTGAILLDMIPDKFMAHEVRAAIENEGDELADFHLWRLGPGHLGAILSIATPHNRGADFYRAKLARFHSLSHITVELAHRS
jgi:cation diffusion facilitator family transporter